jgi:hypothetical protein
MGTRECCINEVVQMQTTWYDYGPPLFGWLLFWAAGYSPDGSCSQLPGRSVPSMPCIEAGVVIDVVYTMSILHLSTHVVLWDSGGWFIM